MTEKKNYYDDDTFQLFCYFCAAQKNEGRKELYHLKKKSKDFSK